MTTLKNNLSKTMLLVEDNEIAQRMIINFVISIGFALDIANNGTEAMALFQPGKYATIWMDIGLPDFDGHEVARRMRELEKGTHCHVPIIGVSAHAPDDLVLNPATGLNAMLIKPMRADKAKALLVEYGVIETV